MKHFKVFMVIALLLSVVGMANAQVVPSVVVSDQASLDGTVTITQVTSDGPGFVVIHKANDQGGFGPVIGFRWVNDGESFNVAVNIDASQATGTLFAMLHADTNEIGLYEFGRVDGADTPVSVDGAVVSPSFNVELVRAYDQLLSENTLTIANVVTAQNGFIVIHSDGGGRPGPVLGTAPVVAGVNSNVVVALEGDVTDVVYPMLHVDTGEAGVYEFGTVEGADGPVVVNGVVATFPIIVGYPAMRVPSQIVTDTVKATSISMEVDGWLVIHADNGSGGPGPVIGQAQVPAGVSMNVEVAVDAAGVTPVLFPMMHVDTGEAGVYEFGTVEGADGPVMANGSVLVYPINAAPTIVYRGSLSGTTLTVDAALINVQGWLVIHADNGSGGPGPVIGQTPLVRGWTKNVVVELNADGITPVLFPMLHVDTGEAGVYEFGSVEGADGPVRVGDAVVVGALTPASE